jgi:L-lactate dehydrogenase complex protein LldE
MHVNTGYQADALPLIRHHAEVFDPYDAIVAPSGSCAGSVRHQHAMVASRAGRKGLASRAGSVASRTYELSEFLVDVLGVDDVGAYYPHRVTYHPTCHSLRLLRVGDKPLRLLRNVRGIDLVELPEADQCCGFGGRLTRFPAILDVYCCYSSSRRPRSRVSARNCGRVATARPRRR